MRFVEFVARFQVRFVLAMTGHIGSGVFGLIEHLNGHTLAGWTLFGVCWFMFYITAYTVYRESEKRRAEDKQLLSGALEQQGKDITGLRDLIRTRETEIDQLISQIGQLCVQTEQLSRENTSLVKKFTERRPYVTLTFADVDYTSRYQPVPYLERTEFTATCANSDAFSVYIKRVQIGSMYLQSRVWTDKISCGHSKKLEYSLLYHDPNHEGECVNLEFRGHLRKLLDKTIAETKEESLVIPITICYSDAEGNPWETTMNLVYHPGVPEMPMMAPQTSSIEPA